MASNKISFWSAVLMNINIIVGAGILFAPDQMARVAGSVSFLAWPLVGLLVFPVVWSIAQAALVFPGEGGFFNYCSKGISPFWGFVAHWSYTLGYIGTATALTLVLSDALVAKAGIACLAPHTLWIRLGAAVFFVLLNLMSISVISRIQSFATVLKLVPLFLCIALAGFYFDPSITYTSSDLFNLGVTIPSAIFAFWGFEACTSIGHLLKDGPSAVGRVTLVAFFITVLLYTAFHFGVLHIMGLDNLMKEGAALFPQHLGFAPNIVAFIAKGIIAAIILSYCNSLFGVSLANISNLFMVAKKKAICGGKFLLPVNSCDRPTNAAFVYLAVLVGLIFLISDINVAFALTNMGVSTAFVLTLVALFRYYLARRDYAQILVTLMAAGTCSVIIYFSWITAGADTVARLMNVTPLLAGLVIGLALFSMRKKG